MRSNSIVSVSRYRYHYVNENHVQLMSHALILKQLLQFRKSKRLLSEAIEQNNN